MDRIFIFSNFFIGKPNTSFLLMTIVAYGVKVYQNLNHAMIFNANLNTKKYISEIFPLAESFRLS